MSSLKRHLDSFIEQFPKEKHLASDPVQFVHRYDDPKDREIVGLISAVFAHGNVKSVLRTVEKPSSVAFGRSAPVRLCAVPSGNSRRLPAEAEPRKMCPLSDRCDMPSLTKKYKNGLQTPWPAKTIAPLKTSHEGSAR
jgi:hypothetical protein